MSKKIIFNTEEELTNYIEANTCYDVLGIFDSYINVIDRYESDEGEKMLPIDREVNGHIVLL